MTERPSDWESKRRLPVYYIRHNWQEPEFKTIINKLFEDEKIGICFDREQKTQKYPFNPKSYEGRASKASINCLNKCNKSNSLIVARYKDHDRILIGKSETSSRNLWIFNDIKIKYLKLKDVKEVTINDFPLPFLIAPPFSTFVHWKMGELAVNTFYFKQGKTISFESLSPWHLEILCEEWLRREKILIYKTYKTGGSMEKFDIVGIGENDNIIAQVKRKATKEKIEEFFNLVNRMENTSAFFFTDSSTVPDDRIISLKEVFDDFCDQDKKYLERLIYSY